MRYFVGILVIASILGCNSENVQSVARGNDKFTANTYKELVKISGNDNIIVSGLSAQIVLSLLANGANGATQSQLLTGLGLPQNLELANKGYEEILTRLNINNQQMKLLLANKIYPAETFPISKKFNDIADNVYHAGVQNLNYSEADSAANTINKWVENQTNNKIKDLVDPSSLSPGTVLVLVNALYFSGKWNQEFEKYNTRKGDFYTSASDSKQIDYMHTDAPVKYSYNDKLKAKFLELGFRGGHVSMTCVLPDSRTGLGAVEENLTDYLEPQKMERTQVAITLPKFTVNTKIDFLPILQSLGIKDVFTSQSDLSGISDAGPLKVDFVVQKAFIDVNEDGVEAAAATTVGVVGYSLPRPPKYTFNADHPFFFYIKEKSSGVTLFAGRFNQ